jgi:hypothetical protein
MFREPSLRRTRRRPVRVAAGIAVTSAMVVFGSGHVAAASGLQTVTGATQGGILSITAPGGVILPTLVAGNSTAATDLGSLTWTDTLNDATVSSVTLAATNLWAAASTGLYIPFADFTITVDPSPTANVMNSGTAAVVPPGSPYALAGSPTMDFSTLSTPITLATASATSEGTWTQAGNQISIAVPANTTPSTSFTMTIQYTVTG